MQLPNHDNAFIQPQKLTKYLLSETHDVGKSKAKFFREIGFNQTNLEQLKQELLNVAKIAVVTEVIETIHGAKYVIIDAIKAPSGRSVTILTVWMIDRGETAPRFITARPYKQ